MQTKPLSKAGQVLNPEPLHSATKQYPHFTSFQEASLYWLEYGYNVIPIIPSAKLPAVKWDGWLTGLSKQKIRDYWLLNSTHELGFIVGEGIIALDADSQESIAALVEIEKSFDVRPNLIVKTAKGEHHHFKRARGTEAKSDAHCTDKFPARIDVKTGRALVILPPSTGKSIAFIEAGTVNDLTEVGQDFIDAINRHNGRNTPLPANQSSSINYQPVNTDHACLGLKALLEHIDADSGYDDWLRVLMGIFHYTRGNDDGFEIAKAWSSKSSKYKGENEISAKWNSFNLDHPRPVTLGTIISLVQNGHEIYHEAENPFEVVNNVAGGVAQ